MPELLFCGRNATTMNAVPNIVMEYRITKTKNKNKLIFENIHMLMIVMIMVVTKQIMKYTINHDKK